MFGCLFWGALISRTIGPTFGRDDRGWRHLHFTHFDAIESSLLNTFQDTRWPGCSGQSAHMAVGTLVWISFLLRGLCCVTFRGNIWGQGDHVHDEGWWCIYHPPHAVNMWMNPVFSGYGTSALHHLVDLALYVQLRVFGLHAFQLDGHFLSNGDVGA